MAVGITSHTNLPTYKEMYSGKDDSRFTRRNAGQKFEFSTAGGKFILIAEMDGDSTLKPVLRVSLIPKDESLLGSNIRYGIFSHFDSRLSGTVNSIEIFPLCLFIHMKKLFQYQSYFLLFVVLNKLDLTLRKAILSFLKGSQ